MKALSGDTEIADTVQPEPAVGTLLPPQLDSRRRRDSLWAPAVVCALNAFTALFLEHWRIAGYDLPFFGLGCRDRHAGSGP